METRFACNEEVNFSINGAEIEQVGEKHHLQREKERVRQREIYTIKSENDIS